MAFCVAGSSGMRSTVCLRSLSTCPEVRAGNWRRASHGRHSGCGRDHGRGHRRQRGHGWRDWLDRRTRRWRDRRRAERRRRLYRRACGSALEDEHVLPGRDRRPRAVRQRRPSRGRVLVASAGQGPDGVAVDVAGGHIYWTGMGVPSANDGNQAVRPRRHERRDARPRRRDVHPQADQARSRGRQNVLVRSRRDAGHAREPRRLGRRSPGDHGPDRRRPDGRSRWCVGIALDLAGGYLYWSQKGPADGTSARCGARTSRSRPVRRPSTAPTSRCSTTSCPSRSTSTWTSRRVQLLDRSRRELREPRRIAIPAGSRPRPATTGRSS